jgi:arsenate reductase
MVPPDAPGSSDGIRPDASKNDGIRPDASKNDGIKGFRAGRPKLGGRGVLAQRPAPASKKRVLFVCIGNSCRSQMAEGFARAYGSDVIEVHSAGLAPAPSIAPLTKVVLAEKNLSLDDQFPKGLDFASSQRFDIVVNMTGAPLDLAPARILDWPVPDPIGKTPEVYRTVAAQIEGLVMRLILELRSSSR